MQAGIEPGNGKVALVTALVCRQRIDRHADQAIKIMMNSMFGIFAAPACRFFSPELANAITHFGQQTLAWTCESFERRGVKVLYGDTDSVFVQLPEDEGAESCEKKAEALRQQVAKEIVDRIHAEYDVEARLDLELEKIFSRFLLPRVRGGKGGSKKRYAGWVGDPKSGLEVREALGEAEAMIPPSSRVRRSRTLIM